MTTQDQDVPITYLPEVDSTNIEALRYVANGDKGPRWICATEQQTGRGRSGREWASLKGNLFASYLEVLPAPQPKGYQLSLVAGVAVAKAIAKLMPKLREPVRLKWPNDLMIKAAKVGGILVESSTSETEVVVVIGVGLNLIAAPDDLDRPATSLALSSEGGAAAVPTPLTLLPEIATQMSYWLGVWSYGDGFAAVREAWLDLGLPVGEELSVHAGGVAVAGTFAGLTDDGLLILTTSDGSTRTFNYGDVDLPFAS